MTHTSPDADQIATFTEAAETDDGPIVMLNLNRYRDVPVYADGRDVSGRSGRDVYRDYGMVAVRALAEVGAQILWSTEAFPPLAGCEHDAWDEVVAVWYPIKLAADAQRWRTALVQRLARPALVSELWLHPCDSRAGLNGSGLLIVNPPYLVAEAMRGWLALLQRLLAPSGRSHHSGHAVLEV